MKADIHPSYGPAVVRCACGHTWETRSTKPELRVEVCSDCHPFYTGEQRIMDTAGRVERFRRRFGLEAEPSDQDTTPPASEETSDTDADD